MNGFVLLIFALGALLCAGRGLDLAFGTDPATGLCVVGAVWWRYAVLCAVVLLCLAVGRCVPAKPEALRRRSPLLGGLALLSAAAFAVLGAVRLSQGFGSFGAAARGVLELLCAVWMLSLGLGWLRRAHGPACSLLLAVAGSVVFYWQVLSRFMENSSSWHRVEPTAAAWQALAALVFLAALARALCLPDSTDGKVLCMSGLTAFCLCLCWELPQTAARWAVQGAPLQSVLSGAALCCIGALGGACAARCLCRKGAPSAH